jgi:hypothetical protein
LFLKPTKKVEKKSKRKQEKTSIKEVSFAQRSLQSLVVEMLDVLVYNVIN